MTTLENLNPRPDDLVVVPEDMEVSAQAPFQVYRMKFLHQPSIIRSGGYSMGLLDTLAKTRFGAWLGNRAQEMQDSVKNMGQPAVIPEPNSEVQPRIVTGYMGNVQAHGGLPEIIIPQPEAVVKKQEHQEAKVESFFRYVRFHEEIRRLGEQGEEVQRVISPRGGIAFYIELDAANKTFAFSYALCHNNDNFNFQTARKICKGRFEAEQWFEVKNYDSEKSIVENISIALCNFLYNVDADKLTGPSFSSTPETQYVSLYELSLIYKGI